ncbi:hypothetical protein [Paenisporosarcina sp. OV554]|uniref:hypothetical protein n=1 Tax=Paenisporosarcina sp. OV554 TaxID=2135694 RepID=UPI000D3C64F9|nr:hypothetical protein [Paenisporosarcina sp. OV554]PUB12638.1 hypothetical protein C8K15_109137 [Paenisporosarcina sp. OV554]
MLRKYIRRNIPNLTVLLIIGIVMYYAFINDFIGTKTIKRSSHVELLTINSIFIGFLYTTLGVLVGFLGNTKIANLDRSGYMDEYYNTIYFGLFFFITSAVCGLTGIFVKKLELNTILYLVEQISIIAGLCFFIKAIINLSSIIKKVRNNL